jgi:hypothetical protein
VASRLVCFRSVFILPALQTQLRCSFTQGKPKVKPAKFVTLTPGLCVEQESLEREQKKHRQQLPLKQIGVGGGYMVPVQCFKHQKESERHRAVDKDFALGYLYDSISKGWSLFSTPPAIVFDPNHPNTPKTKEEFSADDLEVRP